jgi:hypothetical protein
LSKALMMVVEAALLGIAARISFFSEAVRDIA